MNNAGQSKLSTFFTTGLKKKTESKNPTEVQVMKAELRWVWNSASTSKNFNSEDKAAYLLRAMFPDSQIAQSFTCGRNKQAYLLNFAIAPFCEKDILDGMSDCFFSVAFDEADGKMMVVVRYGEKGTGQIRTDMLDFVSIGSDFSADVCSTLIHDTVINRGLLLRNWIGDFSDKCNTMRGKTF